MALLLVALLVEAMKAIGQHQIAAFLPFIALGMPARYLRFADVTHRFALLPAGAGRRAGWRWCRSAGRPVGRRRRWGLRSARANGSPMSRCAGGRASRSPPQVPTSEPLRFEEVARNFGDHRPAPADLSPDQVAADRLRPGRQCRGPDRPRPELASEAGALCAAPSGRLHPVQRRRLGRGRLPRAAQRRAGGDDRRGRPAPDRCGGGQRRPAVALPARARRAQTC